MNAQTPYRLTEFHGSNHPAAALHPTFEVRPTRNEGTEYTVIIGPNGTGKSALLGGLAYATQAKSSDRILNASRVVAIANLVSDSFPLKQGHAANDYHYLGLRQGTNTVTTGALTAASLSALVSLPLSARPDFDWQGLSQRLDMQEPIVVARHIGSPREDSRETRSKREESFRAVEHRLAQVFDQGSYFARHGAAELRQSVELDISDISGRVSLVLDEFSEEFDVSALLRRVPYATGWRLQLTYAHGPSAGQEVLFSQILRVVSAARPRALVLIDEPETALHPQWQSNFIPLLREHVPDELGMHVVLATHSPFLVGEADSVVAASDQGFVQLEADFGTLSIDAIVYQVFGASNSGSVVLEHDLSVVLEYISDDTTSNLPTAEVDSASQRLRARRTESTELLAAALDEFDLTVDQRQRGER